MSVQSGPTFKRYAANGVTTVFAIPFLLIEPGDLMVTLNGVEITSGFALTGVGNPTSTATFTVAPAGDLLFQLMVPFERLTDYQENGDLLALTLNNDLDRIWQALKELRRDDSRSLTVSPLEPEGIPPLPVKAQRALRTLAFTASGDPVPSNLTLGELEEQPAIAAAAAQAAAASAGRASASEIAGAQSELKAQAWAENPVDTPVEPGKFSAKHYAEKAAQAVVWASKPIGEVFGLWDHMTGVQPPPTNDPAYRYIRLTAADSYNAGVLIGEVVSGSPPLVQATSIISDVGGPMNGMLVRLINTERRTLKAGASGTPQSAAYQDHTHGVLGGAGSANATGGTFGLYGGSSEALNTLGGTTDTSYHMVGSRSPKNLISSAGVVSAQSGDVANETRVKNVGVTYYMRIR